MPKPKKSDSLSETQQLSVLLEGVHSQQKLTLEGLKDVSNRLERLEASVGDLGQKVERGEFRLGRVEQQLDSFHHAILTNANEIQRLQHDIQKLQHDVVKLAERIEVHEKLHAT